MLQQRALLQRAYVETLSRFHFNLSEIEMYLDHNNLKLSRALIYNDLRKIGESKVSNYALHKIILAMMD